jgi:hypothetical protein
MVVCWLLIQQVSTHPARRSMMNDTSVVIDGHTIPVRIIPGWLEYAVTSEGDVVSLTRHVMGKTGLRSHSARILRSFPVGKSREYLGVVLCRHGRIFRHRVHRLVAEAFFGPCPDGCDVDHINFITTDNRVENLRYLPAAVNRGSRKGNSRNDR